jgi:hypothetical protein
VWVDSESRQTISRQKNQVKDSRTEMLMKTVPQAYPYHERTCATVKRKPTVKGLGAQAIGLQPTMVRAQ